MLNLQKHMQLKVLSCSLLNCDCSKGSACEKYHESILWSIFNVSTSVFLFRSSFLVTAWIWVISLSAPRTSMK